MKAVNPFKSRFFPLPDSGHCIRVQRGTCGLFLFCILFTGTVFSQYLSEDSQSRSTSLPLSFQEQGLPFITNYTPEDYQAFNQNWDTVQDSLGILYFANGDGVLMYDGVHWEVIPLPNKTHAKSITIDENNTVYVGAFGEFGYLAPDESGSMQYVSLVPHLNKKNREFTTVWESIATPGGIFFKTNEALYRWFENGFKIWEISGSRLFFVHDTLYTFTSGQGLMYLDEEDNISPVPAGEVLANEAVMVLLPYGNNSLLAGTYDNGLFLFEEGAKKRFLTQADDYFFNNKLYTGIRLFNGTYAFGTLTGGLVVIDPDGKQLLRLSGNEILVSDIIHRLYQDRQGILWASLNDGIAKIEYPSPFTIFGNAAGINSRVQLITRYQDKILTGTGAGLYFLERSETGRSSFRLFHNTHDKVWDLLDFDGVLLVGLRDEVYQINKDTTQLLGDWNPSAFFRSELGKNRVFISMGDGFRSIYYQNGTWIDEGKMEGITGSTYTIVEMDSGDLWLETSEAWVWNISFESREQAIKLENPIIKRYDSEQGLPEDAGDIYLLNNSLYFAAANDQKTFEYDPATDRFRPAHTLHQILNIQDDQFYINHIDQDKNVWFTTHREGRIMKWVAWNKNNNGYIVEDLEQSRIIDDLGGSRSLYYESRDSVLWLASDKSVLRHDLKIQEKRWDSFYTLIKKVTFKGDSLLVQGNYHSSRPEVPFKGNQFRFEYASPVFYKEHANQYQSFLEGFDEQWSGWTTETQRDFTNLREGEYRFRVRGKDINGWISGETVFAFTILPPWHRTWWAYGMYILLFTGLVIGFVKWRSHKLKQENEALQKIVEEQTRQVKQQAEQLKELDEAKSRFFANISHEFRTPLTLILGQVQQLESGGVASNPKPIYEMIKRNGKQVLSLVNQLLDLSTLESGNMKLKTIKTDLVAFLRPIVAAYDSLAESKGIQFEFEPDEENLPVYLDTDKTEKIVQNVISNAFKFTPEGGRITVSVIRNHTKGNAQIRVTDNGPGIVPEKVEKIFDRFYRNNDLAGNGEGSGIGLALAKELVTLHKGTISAESKMGEGACFIITLPLGTAHLNDDEIMEEAGELDDTQISKHTAEAITDYSSETESVFEDEANKNDLRELPQVLVVEDNKDMRQYIRQILQTCYQVEEAADGSEGLEKAANTIPDLIISDVMMPEMDGFELCAHLKNDERTSHVPVVLLTAKAGKESKLEGLEHQADDYLTKPFDADELLALLKNRIEQRARLRERFSREVTVQPKDITITSADERFLQRAIEIVEENMDDFEFSVETFIEQMYLGRTQVNRKIKALTDLTPVQFIRSLRLKRAAQKIAKQEDTISQIAYSVGFNNLSYFAKCFKDQFGESPSDYNANQNQQ